LAQGYRYALPLQAWGHIVAAARLQLVEIYIKSQILHGLAQGVEWDVKL